MGCKNRNINKSMLLWSLRVLWWQSLTFALIRSFIRSNHRLDRYQTYTEYWHDIAVPYYSVSSDERKVGYLTFFFIISFLPWKEKREWRRQGFLEKGACNASITLLLEQASMIWALTITCCANCDPYVRLPSNFLGKQLKSPDCRMTRS